MSGAIDQAHAKFKMFVGELDADQKPSALAREVEAFVASANIAPKSIGVEYLESARRLVLTLGYRDDEPGYKVALQVASLGKTADLTAAGLSQLEQKLTAAAASTANIICHELYVTEGHEFLVIFMTTPT